MKKSFRDFGGTQLFQVWLNNVSYNTEFFTLPSEHRTFNFELKGSCNNLQGHPIHLLVLDPYGDETLPSRMRRRLHLGDVCQTPLAVDMLHGHIYLASFSGESESVDMLLRDVVESDEWSGRIVPKKYLKKLKTLLSEKRPFSIGLLPQDMGQFIERETGYQELRQLLTVTLHFSEFDLEISHFGVREITRWI